jgi:hypothetical protein
MKSRFRRIWPLVLPVAAVAFLCCLGLLFWASQHGWLSYMARIRILMGMVSGLVLLVTLESLRRYHLRERYAILWMVTGLLILLTAIFPEALDRVRLWFGMQYVTAVVAIVFTFLILVVFHFSIALSGLRDDLAALARRCAILDAQLAELRKPSTPPEPPPPAT